jgi:NAD(P)H-dependent flavin oxidoreductase YrpB (nitropropane dioxygenase family)
MRLTSLLGTSLPIIQAPMAGVQLSALAIAVGRAGALGSLPCAMLSPIQLRGELQTLRDAKLPSFNVNFFGSSGLFVGRSSVIGVPSSANGRPFRAALSTLDSPPSPMPRGVA